MTVQLQMSMYDGCHRVYITRATLKLHNYNINKYLSRLTPISILHYSSILSSIMLPYKYMYIVQDIAILVRDWNLQFYQRTYTLTTTTMTWMTQTHWQSRITIDINWVVTQPISRLLFCYLVCVQYTGKKWHNIFAYKIISRYRIYRNVYIIITFFGKYLH